MKYLISPHVVKRNNNNNNKKEWSIIYLYFSNTRKRVFFRWLIFMGLGLFTLLVYVDYKSYAIKCDWNDQEFIWISSLDYFEDNNVKACSESGTLRLLVIGILILNEMDKRLLLGVIFLPCHTSRSECAPSLTRVQVWEVESATHFITVMTKANGAFKRIQQLLQE